MKHRIKPRNPLVAPTLFRKAGQHHKSSKAIRRKEKMETATLPVFTDTKTRGSCADPTDFTRRFVRSAPGCQTCLCMNATLH